MALLRIVLGIACAIASVSQAAKLVDLKKCQRGCRLDQDCALYSRCTYLDPTIDSCGFCVCGDGYKAQGAKCVPKKGYSTTTVSTTTTGASSQTTSAETTLPVATATAAPQTESPTTTEATTASTTTIPTTTGTTSQGPPPTNADPVNCADYACTVGPPFGGSDTNPLQVQSSLVTGGPPSGCKRELVTAPRPCNLQGGGACYGSYCLSVSPGNDYCICPYYKVDRQCSVDKPGSCNAATGQAPAGLTTLQGKRFRNKSNKDHGSIYARHFAANLNDCIKLCQWAQNLCRSVNFGQIGGTNICELLSTAATEKNLLASWLETASGWQYVQIAP